MAIAYIIKRCWKLWFRKKRLCAGCIKDIPDGAEFCFICGFKQSQRLLCKMGIHRVKSIRDESYRGSRYSWTIERGTVTCRHCSLSYVWENWIDPSCGVVGRDLYVIRADQTLSCLDSLSCRV
jgi:hypothetical protein